MITERAGSTAIPGLYVIDVESFHDMRGTTRRNYCQDDLAALGLPPFEVTQNNIAFSKAVGTTRGFHAEPWEKYITVVHGEALGAWVDLREGSTFGTTVEVRLTPDKAVYVPRGVANSYQTQTEGMAYSYLINGSWPARDPYPLVYPFDADLGIQWPIPREHAILAAKDADAPPFAATKPVRRQNT